MKASKQHWVCRESLHNQDTHRPVPVSSLSMVCGYIFIEKVLDFTHVPYGLLLCNTM